jgi:ribose 5-phosphate isomerase A
MDPQPGLAALADAALSLIEDGMVVGLGSGRAATAFVEALGQRVGKGLRIRGIPTSIATANFARKLGIPLTTLDEANSIDIDVDGADEVDPRLNLIKGLGGALVREKIVAAAAKRFVVLVTPEKLVPALGSRGVLPVEVVPFALSLCTRRIKELGFTPVVRQFDGAPCVTDNGNHIFDCRIPTLQDPQKVDRDLRAIPGVVGTGLFLGMADTVLIARGDQIETRRRS